MPVYPSTSRLHLSQSCLPLQFLSSPVIGKGKAADAGGKVLSKEEVAVRLVLLCTGILIVYLKQPTESAPSSASCWVHIEWW